MTLELNAAYGWGPSLTDAEILARLLALNQERGLATSAAPNVRIDRRGDYIQGFASNNQVRRRLPALRVKGIVGCGLSRLRSWAHSIPEKDDAGPNHDPGGIGN
jgi:hypothetical protein